MPGAAETPAKLRVSALRLRSGRRDSNPRHLAWEAMPTAATLDDRRRRTQTTMRVSGVRRPRNPYESAERFPGVWGMSGARPRPERPSGAPTHGPLERLLRLAGDHQPDASANRMDDRHESCMASPRLDCGVGRGRLPRARRSGWSLRRSRNQLPLYRDSHRRRVGGGSGRHPRRDWGREAVGGSTRHVPNGHLVARARVRHRERPAGCVGEIRRVTEFETPPGPEQELDGVGGLN